MATYLTEADAELTRRIGPVDLQSDLALGLLKRRFDGVEGSRGSEVLPRLRTGGVHLVGGRR